MTFCCWWSHHFCWLKKRPRNGPVGAFWVESFESSRFLETLQRILSYKEVHQELLDLTTLQVPVQYKYLGCEKGVDRDDSYYYTLSLYIYIYIYVDISWFTVYYNVVNLFYWLYSFLLYYINIYIYCVIV